MNLLLAPITLLCDSLALSACGGAETSSPGASESNTPFSREARSYTQNFSEDNQLKDWWGGTGIPITWKVSGGVELTWAGKTDLSIASMSMKTPRGLLQYDVVMNCDANSQHVLIRNYQKR